MRNIILVISIVLIFFLVPLRAHAQFVPNTFSLNAAPETPGAGETVVITASTPTTDENTLIFTWTIDGITRNDLSGQGKNRITLIAGKIGVITRISVRARRVSNQEFASASLTIRPANLSLVWHAQTLIPRWYQGKALPSARAIVRVSAIPEFVVSHVSLKPESLIYRWSFDDEEQVLAGVGEQVLTIRTKDFADSSHDIRVVVEDVNKQIRKEAQIFLTTTEPEGNIYLKTPSGGVEFRRSITRFSPYANSSMLDFQFEPFFFPVATRKALSYQWQTGQAAVSGSPQNPYLLTIQTAGQSGSIPISVTVNDNDPFVPGVFKSFTLDL
ncbi:MAG: hypothetical protein G01um101466_71 [Parcubacteria group bacterium Gr01-1014_66]|nr:MAG: hypothetical protein G01um101466_71 [Parcubacteria group bacterium Gr01-1014_66]